ncbi:olfactory receptor 52K2-like isoform X2 [Anguilla anguilla]|uniref:olfactory receptor 52K2-like isoform X2 n=1 Tax=Anguilla anguilla TaxID=7936 RepID=UPI0015B32ABB|nr:olfactory receptor 52K2-like isoform X2 [Anguilla anguilla]
MEMKPNSSDLPPFFYMEALGLLPSQTYFAVVMGTVAYCFILAGNMTMILSITLNRSLHKPMYLMLLNLPVNDLMGATAFFPQLISSIALEDRSISCAACFLQGLLVHLYGGGAYIILTAMAYDRFLAICYPLSIADMYCNNPSLVKLVCGDTSINNYYGLFLSSFLQGMSLLAVVFTYVQILVACLTNKQSDTKSKALRTCATHLVIFLVFQVTAIFKVVSHKLNQSPYLKRAMGVSMLLFPPMFNPLIYGLNTKEIRSVVIHFITKKKATSFDR